MLEIRESEKPKEKLEHASKTAIMCFLADLEVLDSVKNDLQVASFSEIK